MLRRIAELLGILAPLAVETPRLYEIREREIPDLDLSRMFASTDPVLHALSLAKAVDRTAYAARMPDGSMVIWEHGDPVPACIAHLIPTSAEAGVLPSHRKQA
jgi:hypothetical protein